MSVAEAAKALAVSTSTIRHRIECGDQRALREITNGRTRVWVLLEESAFDGDSAKLLPHDDLVPHLGEQLPARSDSPPSGDSPLSGDELRLSGPDRVMPPTSWVVGWALREPASFDWVAPSSAGRPELTASLSEARIHRTIERARTYAKWLPIQVQPAEVAVDGEHEHLDRLPAVS